MHPKLISPTLAVLASLAPISAQAQGQAEIELKQFCTDPVSYVCDAPIEQSAQEIAAEDAYGEAIEDAADNLAKKLGHKHGIFDQTEFMHQMEHGAREYFDILAAHAGQFVTTANQVAYQQTGKIPPTYQSIQTAFKEAKKSVETLYLSRAKNFGHETALMKVVRDLEFLTPLDFASPHNRRASPYLHNYIYGCRLDESVRGPTSNAIRVAGSSVIFVCSGDVVDAILNASNPDSLVEMKFTFGHEIAHAFYTEHDNQAVIDCMQSEVTSDITGNEGLRKKLALRDANEYVADLYGIKLVVDHLKKIREKTKAETTLRRLHAARAAVQDLCGTPPFDGHPLGDVRIEQIFRRHPDVDALFGCGAMKTKNPHHACTLQGKSVEKY